VSAPAGLQRDFPLARLTTLGTGGPARWFGQPGTLVALRVLLGWADGEGQQIAVVGLGSNLLVSDEGYDGLVLQLAGELAAIEIGESSATCGGGASLAAVVRRTRDAGLSGIEFGSAIPGTVGGAVRMNAGAYGGELRDVLAEATVVSAAGDRTGGPHELAMSYRYSNVAPGEVVARARLALIPAPVEQIRETVRSMQGRRSASQPRKARTFGSVFKNPAAGPGAGALIEGCGLKGHVVGGARISPVHANFIENVGDARSADVAALIRLARERVHGRWGLDLEHEVELLGAIALD